MKRWSINHCCCLVAESYLTLLQHHGLCSPRGYSLHGIFQARILKWVAISYSRDVPDPGIEPTSPVSLLHCRWILYHWAIGEPLGKVDFEPNHGISEQPWHIYEGKVWKKSLFEIVSGDGFYLHASIHLYACVLCGVRMCKNRQDPFV